MEVLKERKETHGPYKEVCDKSSIAYDLFNNDKFDTVTRTSMYMVVNKLARASAGTPGFIDNWRDIAGYAQLVVNHLGEKPGAIDVEQVKLTIGEGK